MGNKNASGSTTYGEHMGHFFKHMGPFSNIWGPLETYGASLSATKYMPEDLFNFSLFFLLFYHLSLLFV